MAIDLNWKSSQLLYVKYYDTVTGEEALTLQREIGADPRFDKLHGILLDASGIKESLVDLNDIKMLAAITKAQALSNPSVKSAVIMEPTEEGQALASFYKLLAETTNWKIELFRKEEEAREWLET